MTTLVMLPGMHADAALWDAVRAALPQRLDTVAVNLAPTADLDALADEVAATLQPGTVLVGHSFGGVVSMRVAQRHPGLLAGVVLVSASYDKDAPEVAAQRAQKAAALDEDGYLDMAVGRLGAVFTAENAADPGVIAERQRAVQSYGLDRYRAHSAALGQRDGAAFFADVDLPVLVIAGTQDQVVDAEGLKAWAHGGAATCVEIPDAAHMAPAETPDAVAAAISEWWRTTEAGRGFVPSSLPAGPLPAYEVHGEGETTLFVLHGAYGNRQYFDDAIARWNAAGLRVVAWTCPGYAADDEVPEGYGIPLLAEYAARMVLQERTARNALLGHSMGSLIGPRVPALVGDALDALILSAGSAGFVNRTAEDKEKYLAERVKPIVEDGLSVSEYAVGLLRTMMAPGAAGPLVDRVIEVVTEMKTESFVASMRAITEYNSVPSLEALRIPTLMLPGEHDPATTAAGMRRMQGLVPGAEYYEIADAGHYAFAEKAEEYHQVTTDFITRALAHSRDAEQKD